MNAREPRYRPKDYWDDRLSAAPGLRGVGHIGYGDPYNRWVYRRKGAVLGTAFDMAGIESGKQDVTALDVGSGTGWVIEQLLQRTPNVSGVEITDVALGRLRARFPQLTLEQAEIGKDPLPFPPSSFDVVTMMDVAYHIVDDAALSNAIGEIARVLKDDGSLIITDRLGDSDDDEAAHVRMRSRGYWSAAGASHGLELRIVAPCYRWLSRSREASWMRVLPQQVRGVVEYSLDRAMPNPPHLRWALLTKRAGTVR
jgi:SAM-dependent methyltransferase